MPKTNRRSFKAGQVFEHLVEQARELTSKPVESISESVSSQSVNHIDNHYLVAKNEEIQGLVTLLKDQEQYLSRQEGVLDRQEQYLTQLSDAIQVNEDKIGGIEGRLDQQVEVLKADNRQCATELKEMIEGSGPTDMEGLMNQQRAHTVEMDRMMMSLKTSIEKNIEKSKGVIEKKVETTSGQGRGLMQTTMILTILNTICLIGFIIYSLVL